MKERCFIDMAFRYAAGTLTTNQIEELWVRVLMRPELLDLLLIIVGVKMLCDKGWN